MIADIDFTSGVELFLVVVAASLVVGKSLLWSYKTIRRIDTYGRFLDEQMRPNGGTSMRDVLDRIERRQLTIEKTLKDKGISDD